MWSPRKDYSRFSRLMLWRDLWRYNAPYVFLYFEGFCARSLIKLILLREIGRMAALIHYGDRGWRSHATAAWVVVAEDEYWPSSKDPPAAFGLTESCYEPEPTNVRECYLSHLSICFPIYRITGIGPQWLFLFPNLKKWLGGQRFTSNEEVVVETDAYFEDLPKSYFLDGSKKLEKRLEKCIELKED